MSSSARKGRKALGISVYPRRGKWAFLVSTEPDILTGKRKRLYRGDLESEEAAWTAAIKTKSEMEEGRHLRPSRRTIEQFLIEWLASIEHSVKPTTFANYVDNANAYIVPVIGHRRLQEITVPVLNAFYQQLLKSGRRKPNTRYFRCFGLSGV